MKDKDLVDAGEKYVRQKMKPRGGNSPVIGDNGVMMEAGDASKAAQTIMFIFQNDSYFGSTFAGIKSPEDVAALAATPLDLENVETMKKRFVGFVGYCMMNDIKFGNMAAYTAIGIDKDEVYNWENGRTRTSAHSDFIKKVKNFCGTYRELLGASGAINPVTLVWWQKNYDGLVDSQQVILKPEMPLGTDSDPAELQKRITGSVVEEDEG